MAVSIDNEEVEAFDACPEVASAYSVGAPVVTTILARPYPR